MKQFQNISKQNGEHTALNMTSITQYHRLSTESDEESNVGSESTTSTARHPCSQQQKLNSNYSKILVRKNAIKWNCECICRLLAAYILLMVAMGFAIHSMAPIDQHVSDFSF